VRGEQVVTDDADRPAARGLEGDGNAPDSGVRAVLRDLIPDYSGPADPLLRVGASIRRRRSRRRALLAVGSAAAVATLVAGVSAVLGSLGPARSGPASAAGDTAPATAGPSEPVQPPAVHRVSAGTVAGSRWQVGSTSPGGSARRCLLSDGGGFHRDVVCFDDWRPGDPLAWYRMVVRVGPTPVTQVAGVAPPDAAEVEVRLGSGPPVRAAAVRTTTDPVARFFAVMVEGQVAVRSVRPLRPDGTPLGPAVTGPVAPSCLAGPDNACSSSGPTG